MRRFHDFCEIYAHVKLIVHCCIGETHDDTDGAQTDFAAAAQRARINSLDLESGKFEESSRSITHMPRSRHKKMPDTGMYMYVSQTSVDTSEEEALECAKKDLIKLLNLQVPIHVMNLGRKIDWRMGMVMK